MFFEYFCKTFMKILSLLWEKNSEYFFINFDKTNPEYFAFT